MRTLRSVQLKGRVTLVEASTEQDQQMVDEHSAMFLQAIADTDGHDVGLTRRILPLSVISVELVVEQLFDQSPGPGAGSPVALGR